MVYRRLPLLRRGVGGWQARTVTRDHRINGARRDLRRALGVRRLPAGEGGTRGGGGEHVGKASTPTARRRAFNGSAGEIIQIRRNTILYSDTRSSAVDNDMMRNIIGSPAEGDDFFDRPRVLKKRVVIAKEHARPD